MFPSANALICALISCKFFREKNHSLAAFLHAQSKQGYALKHAEDKLQAQVEVVSARASALSGLRGLMPAFCDGVVLLHSMIITFP